MTTRRVNVNFSDHDYATLRGLAEGEGKTVSDFLRSAIALTAWWERVENEGGRVVVEYEDGRVREIQRL